MMTLETSGCSCAPSNTYQTPGGIVTGRDVVQPRVRDERPIEPYRAAVSYSVPIIPTFNGQTTSGYLDTTSKVPGWVWFLLGAAAVYWHTRRK